MKKKTKKDLKNILDFVINTGKLKKMPRTIWSLMGVKDPEKISGHIFSLTLMAWALGKEENSLNMEKLLKMSFCHEIAAVYTEDLITPYRKISSKDIEKRKKILDKWPRLFQKEKQKMFKRDYKEETKALKKLTKNLNKPLREEMLELFDEYKTLSSPEARFLNQLNVLVVLLEGIQYKKEDPSISIDFLWEWTYEKCDNSLCLDFVEELKKKFYKNK